jgi:hypothetical protein
MHVRAIQALQAVFVQGLAGTFGIMIALAATAFFVPRMLEKGEADTLFSKPVGRFVLLLARYSSGVLFVGLLAFVLVLGMHLGFLLRSGYSDPAFLWSVLSLVYVFALIHAFSTAVGVLTRSAITALLVSVLFFGFNGCVHSLWKNKEHAVATVIEQAEANDSEEARQAERDLDQPIVKAIALFLDSVHYALPKTGDADVLTNQLRRAVSAPEFVLQDPAGLLALERNPEDMTRPTADRVVDMQAQPVTWTAADGAGAAQLTVSRRSRVTEREGSGKARVSRTSDMSAAREFMETLEGRADVDGKPKLDRYTMGRVVRVGVVWTEKNPAGAVYHTRAFYGIEDWMYEFDFQHSAAWRPQPVGADVMETFLGGVKPQRESATDLNADAWYAKQIGWSAPFRFNAMFSIGSSIGFALLMLLIARWKLSRIDF